MVKDKAALGVNLNILSQAGRVIQSDQPDEVYIEGCGMSDEKTQSDKFEELARDLECDEDEARWDERLKKVAKAKPAPEKPKDAH